MKLLQGDCIEQLRRLPEDVRADICLCDPPYSSGGLHAGDRKANTTAKYTDNDFNGAAKLPPFSGDNMDQRSFTEFMRRVCVELRQKTREGGVLALFVDWRNLPAMTDAIQMAGWVWRGVCVWDKGISRNQPGRFRNDCEYIVWASNGDLPIDWEKAKGTKALPGVYHIPIVPGKQRKHQTEKPVELIEKLLAIAPADGLVIDCFMGSSTTGVASVNTGRDFIGIELSPEIYRTAQERIEEALLADAGGLLD